MRKAFLINLLLLIILVCCIESKAQTPIKQLPSPLAMVTYKYEDTYIKITYGRPSKRNRPIFGELVPFGKVWRTGANEASEITITKDILIGGDSVKAGTYTLFSIPDKESWTIILNKELGQWGAFKYNPAEDYKRIKVESAPIPTVYETFSIEFETVDAKQGMINALLKWDKTKVIIPITITPSKG
jgi:hypothetical protein